jgi:hypothetical protein
MRQFACFLFVFGTLAVPAHAHAQTPFSVSAHVGDFHVAVSNYYQVPQREVIVIRERRIRDEELPVVLFISQRARVTPATIVDMRLRGMSWWDISVRYGIRPEVYYVPVVVTPGPPYGKAWGHYKKKHRKQWDTIVLSDDDVVSLVQVRFLSDYYRIPPERVIEYRGHHADYVAVNYEVARGRSGRQDEDERAYGRGNGNGKDNGKGKGRGKHGGE